jgi:uncharacterized protein DUF6644
MHEWLLSVCNWLQNTSVGLAVGGTLWGFPYVQLIHFFGLSLWVGTIVMVDLRLLGLAGKNQSVSQLSKNLTPWTWTGLAIVVTGGGLLFSAAAKSYLDNPAFRVKFPLILMGIAYHVLIQRKVPKWDQPAGIPAVAKAAGFAEMALWIGVITAAVNIPNY